LDFESSKLGFKATTIGVQKHPPYQIVVIKKDYTCGDKIFAIQLCTINSQLL
jgi:hypothetical protein